MSIRCKRTGSYEHPDIGTIARVEGTVNLPGSKSVSNRALLLAALAKGTTRLTNLLDSDDIRHMLAALKTLGVEYQLSADKTECLSMAWGAPLPPRSRWSCFSGMRVRRCVHCVQRCLGVGEVTLTGGASHGGGVRLVIWSTPCAKLGPRSVTWKQEGYPPLTIAGQGRRW